MTSKIRVYSILIAVLIAVAIVAAAFGQDDPTWTTTVDARLIVGTAEGGDETIIDDATGEVSVAGKDYVIVRFGVRGEQTHQLRLQLTEPKPDDPVEALRWAAGDSDRVATLLESVAEWGHTAGGEAATLFHRHRDALRAADALGELAVDRAEANSGG